MNEVVGRSQLTRRCSLLCALSGVLATSIPISVQAQSEKYPDRPVKLIATIPPGSTTDAMLRYLAERMSIALKQPFVVDSRPGANGVLGTRVVATSAPDGYTIGMTSNGTLPAAPSLFKDTGYDPLKSFTHIGLFSYLPYVLVVQKDVLAADLKEFIADARTKAGRYNVGYYANSLRMAASDFDRAAQIKATEVPYKTSSQLLTDLNLGLVQFAFVPLSVATTAQQAGYARIVAVTTEKRWSLLPDTPSVAEELPGFLNVAWTALSAPAGTSALIINKLKSSLDHILGQSETRERWRSFGAEVATGDAQAVNQMIEREMPLWSRFAKEANIEPQ